RSRWGPTSARRRVPAAGAGTRTPAGVRPAPAAWCRCAPVRSQGEQRTEQRRGQYRAGRSRETTPRRAVTSAGHVEGAKHVVVAGGGVVPLDLGVLDAHGAAGDVDAAA